MKRRGWVLIPILVAVLLIVLFKIVFLIGYVPSASMEPTLKEGSFILGLRSYGNLDTGDIIIFEHDGQLLVKRIVATEGETVEIGDKTYVVPEDCFFVLGDNIENSIDSRFWFNPFVGKNEVRAKVVLPKSK